MLKKYYTIFILRLTHDQRLDWFLIVGVVQRGDVKNGDKK